MSTTASTSTSTPTSSCRSKSKSTPSLFNNEYSRGPLYQYWSEKAKADAALRQQRILEVKERAKGCRESKSGTCGPSSSQAYARRLHSQAPPYTDSMAGTVDSAETSAPAYPVDDQNKTQRALGQEDDGLPSYDEATDALESEPSRPVAILSQNSVSMSDQSPSLHELSRSTLSASEEKQVLAGRNCYEDHSYQNIDSSVPVLFQTNTVPNIPSLPSASHNLSAASNEDGNNIEGGISSSNTSDPKEKGKRKTSVGGKIGNWLGTAATGYNTKGDRSNFRW